MTKEIAEKIIEKNLVPNTYLEYPGPVVLVGIRGRGINGNPEDNGRGKYNDELAWYAPGFFASHRSNVDPSRYRPGTGSGSAKGMATLQPGVWQYQKGLHKGLYWAFRQYSPVAIWRDGWKRLYKDILGDTINIHEGSRSGGTSSAGCQTLPYGAPWQAFKEQGYKLLDKYNQKWFHYILVDQDELDKGNFKAGV